MSAFGEAAQDEDEAQDDKDTQQRQLDIGAKDGEKLAEAQGHNRAPGSAPDKDQRNRHFNKRIAQFGAPELIACTAKPEGFDGRDSSYRQGSGDPQRIGDPIQHSSQSRVKASSSQFTPLIDATLFGKGAAKFC